MTEPAYQSELEQLRCGLAAAERERDEARADNGRLRAIVATCGTDYDSTATLVQRMRAGDAANARIAELEAALQVARNELERIAGMSDTYQTAKIYALAGLRALDAAEDEKS